MELTFAEIRELVAQHESKLKKIKVFLVDVDGILTDGRVYFAGTEVGFNRFFHVADGYGLKMLRGFGLKVGIISGGNSLGLQRRVEDLKIDYSFLGNEDKREAYLTILKDGYKDEEILFMGDEFFDLPLLKRAGFSATVPHASPEIKESVDYITGREAGKGCVREVIDLLRLAQGHSPFVKDF